jgi:hypothetical protein
MIYTFDLRFVGFVVGIALIVVHLVAIVNGETVRGWLRAFPRSKPAGIALLTVIAVWAFWLVATMDLGEFTRYRQGLEILVPVAWFLSWKFVDEFLAVRALGMLALLIAEPLLEAAFLRPEQSRLLLVVLAYVWVVFGMFWIGMPYLLRDQIAWLLKSDARWRACGFAGLFYGAAVLVCALAFYQPA